MYIYMPVSFDPRDYRPSWTGNYTYATATIRGFFSTQEKAEAAIRGWDCENDCDIRQLYFDSEYVDDFSPQSFDISLKGTYYVEVVPYEDPTEGDYKIDEIVNEPYSAVYDPDCALGVTDY